MRAYYNEHEKYAAQWLRNLIAAGHIAPGEVDERSIEDVHPSDLRGFTQCHFFAGIGVWSHALRLAGWPDDRPVWTGSCPCQPFSAAGKGAGFDDERHLWPAFHHLIKECAPARVYGEQVASSDGLAWLDLVHADMEEEGYAFAAADLCAAGVGAPHIRQRLYWVADNHINGRDAVPIARIHDAEHHAESCGSSVGLEHSLQLGRQRGKETSPRHVDDGTASQRAQGEHGAGISSAHRISQDRTGPTNGHWRAADWLRCRDDKWRPVEPGTFPLAHGATSRVGRLRAYGNAIVPQVAAAFIQSTM